MTVAKAKGDKGMADILFSRIVRSRGRCERCGRGDGPFETAHIVRRRYSATRCVEDNAWCLCGSCHRATGDDPTLFVELVDRTVGRGRYHDLRLLANRGPSSSPLLWWRAERARLVERCRELGLSTKRTAA